MDILGNYISKCNRLSENIRHIKAIEFFRILSYFRTIDTDEKLQSSITINLLQHFHQ